MPIIHSRSWVAAPVEVAFAFFDDPANLGRIMPPPVRIRVVRIEPAPPRTGSVIELSYGLGPFTRTWTIRLVERVVDERITDTTLAGPMRRFDHTHSFRPAARGTWIEDRVDFHVGPDGPIGAAVDAAAGIAMRLVFTWRHARQRRLLRDRC